MDETNTFIPILICYASAENETIYHQRGTNCIQDFIKKLLEWKKGKQELYIFFHNIRGFDGIFIIKELFEMNLKMERVLSTGQKTLYFEPRKKSKFKDSLSFFNMPLDEFTKTFNLQELKKGWFPHKFNTPENLEYEGMIPDLDYYEHQHMKTSKKEALRKWHAEQVLKDDVWNVRNEMLEYCKSDVNLMK